MIGQRNGGRRDVSCRSLRLRERVRRFDHGRCLRLLRRTRRSGDQPIRIIFPFAAGGSGDALARLIADKMRASAQPAGDRREPDRRGRPDRRAGGEDGGARRQHAAGHADRAAGGVSARLSVAGIRPDRGFHSRSRRSRTFDFGVAVGPQHADAKSLKELVAWAKANPTQAQLWIAGRGLAAAFPRRAVRPRRRRSISQSVAYRGSAAALTDLIGGQIPVVFTTTSDLLAMHKAGRIRMLATSGAQRSQFLPDVPTFREVRLRPRGRPAGTACSRPAKTPPRRGRALQQGDRRGRPVAGRPGAAARLRAAADRHLGRGIGARSRRRTSALLGAGGEGVRLHAAEIGQACVTPYRSAAWRRHRCRAHRRAAASRRPRRRHAA